MTLSTPSPKTGEQLSLRPILKNIFSNWAGLGANLAISFFMAPYTVHKLGDAQYGIWALVLQLTGYMGVFDVGLRSALIRFVSRATARHDKEELSEVLSTTLIFYCALGIVALILGFALGAFAVPFLKIPPEFFRATQITIVLATVTLAVGFPMGMFQAVLSGASRWDLSNAVGLVILVLRTILVLALLHANYGVVALATAHLLTSVLGWSVGVYLAKSTLDFQLHFRRTSRKILGPILDHSSNSLLISLANRINYQIDTVVISFFLPVHFVTVYVIGFELVRYFRELLNGAAQVMAPVVSGLHAHDRSEELRDLILYGGKYISFLGFFGATTLIFVGPQFIGVWMGQQYVGSSGRVLQIIALSLFASATAHMPSHALYGLGRHKVNVWCTAVEAVINIGISLALVRSTGIYGVAASTLIAAFVVRGFVFPAAFLGQLNIAWRDYLFKSVTPPLLCAGVLATVLYGITRLVTLNTYPAIIAAVTFSGVVFASAIWMIALDSEEHAHIKGISSRLMLRLKQ